MEVNYPDFLCVFLVCMPECTKEWETKCISSFVYACVCMCCCSTSSELSQEEIENPGPGWVRVLLHSEEAATPSCARVRV